jgi:hypothetical protein
VVLDLQIYKGTRFTSESKLDTKLFQKEMNLYLYIPPDSFHRETTLRSFISSEIIRYRKCCFHDKDFYEAKALFYNRLLRRAHTPAFLQPLFEAHICRAEVLTPKTQNRILLDKKYPPVFKITNTPRFKHSELKDVVAPPHDLKFHPDFELLFNRSNPIICYKRTDNIIDLLSRKI